VTIEAPDTRDAAPLVPARRRHLWPLFVVVGAATVVGLIALVGGFNEVPLEKLPVIDFGDTYTGPEISATITDTYLTDSFPVKDYDASEGNVYLIVEATLENVIDQPVIFMREAVVVLIDGVIDPDNDDDERYGLVDLRTGDSPGFLQPGLPIEVAYIWEIPADSVKPGDAMVIGLLERFKVYGDPIFGDTAMTRPSPAARIATEVGGLR
jgi:hypothetical protein